MTVTLGNLRRAIEGVGLRTVTQYARVCAETHRTAEIGDALLLRHQVDDRMLRVRIELRRVGICPAEHIPCELDDRDLHTEADAEVRNLMLTRVLCRHDHPLDSTGTETARNQDAIDPGKQRLRTGLLELLGIHPADLHLRTISDAAVLQGLHDTEVGIMQLRILPDDGDDRLAAWMTQILDHMGPVGEIRLRAWQVETLEDRLREMLVLHHERHLVDELRIGVLQHVVRRHITEKADLLPDILRNRILGTADEDIRLETKPLKLTYAHLRRLRLQLLGRMQIRNQRHMNHDGILMTDLLLELTNRLEERLGLDIADRTTNLDDGDTILALVIRMIEITLDLVRDVWDDLDGMTLILTVTLLVEDGPVHLTGGDIAPVIQGLVDETLVMTEIEVGLRTIIRDENLTMLNRVHRTRIDVDVRIELLHGNLIAARLQKTAE